MKFSLIICTYKRPKPLLQLLQSVKEQRLYPDEILIIDGSDNIDTKDVIKENEFKNLKYFRVEAQNRGLTKQRNFGISKVSDESEVVCFLDDDTVLDQDYFRNVLETYKTFPDALGVGGYITNEVVWEKVTNDYAPKVNEFYFDGWKRQDGSRFILRKRLKLDSDCPPGFSPLFSHGRSIGFLPPTNNVYQVEQLMGGVSSFRKSVFEKFSFSEYFEGYGLYEDADFTLRVAKTGRLYVNTAAKLAHFHNASGRPNQYQYGKMVVRNGWYVWRVKNPKPRLKDRFKWNAITVLLTFIRFTNVITQNNKKEALTEALGRIAGLWSLLFFKPKQ
jgi:glycosyltransferase involved in cell wall biosynthesis